MKICNQADEFILDNINPNYAHDLLYLEGAGVTHPDPGYYIQRTQRDRCFRYLYVMEYVISGKGYIECDGKCLDVQAGDFYFLNQGIEATYYPDPNTPYEKRWVNLSGEFIRLMVSAYRLTMPVLVCYMDCDPGIEQIHRILRQTGRESLAACLPDVMRVLIDLFEAVKANQIAHASGENLFNEICSKIERDLCFPLSVEQLASSFYISRSTLYRLFMQNCGRSPKQYILDRKLKLACYLLDLGNSTAYVAETLHFTDETHFSRAFRAQLGITPAAYRKKKA